MSDPVTQYQEAAAKAEELKQKAVEYLRERRSVIEREIASLDKEIAVMTGEKAPKADRVKGPQYVGKQISFRLLSDILRERPDRTLNLRKEGYDTKWMKKLVEENPGKLEFGGGGPWPTVTLK